MKTTTKISLALAGFFCFFFAASLQAQAISCPYVVDNQLSCSITNAEVIFFDCSGGSPVVCMSYPGTTFAPGPNSFSCGSCSNVCDVRVIFGSINIDKSNVGTNVPSGGATLCGVTYFGKWDYGTTIIHP